MSHASADRARTARHFVLFVVAAGVAALLAFWVAVENDEHRSLLRLPEGERRALYERTLSNLESTCAEKRAQGLDEFCHDQAEFIVKFPECDDDCLATADPFRDLPSR